HADDGALIARKHHAIAILGIDPHLVVVVAAGSAFDGHECLAGVGSHVGRGVDDVSAVRILRIDGDCAEVPAAAPKARLAVDELPGGPGIVGEVDTAFGIGGASAAATPSAATASAATAIGRGDADAQIVHDGPHTIRIAGCDGDADLAHEFIGGQ